MVAGWMFVALVAPTGVRAQDEQASSGFHGLAVGTNLYSLSGSEIHGLMVQASIGRWLEPRPRRTGWRLDAFAERLEARAMPVAGVTGSWLLPLSPSGWTSGIGTLYAIGGPGVYYLDHPSTVGSAVRPGFSAGFAFVSASRHPSGIRLSLEARLHGIPGPRTRHFVLPVSLGILF